MMRAVEPPRVSTHSPAAILRVPPSFIRATSHGFGVVSRIVQ
jgi:hypothetical protein